MRSVHEHSDGVLNGYALGRGCDDVLPQMKPFLTRLCSWVKTDAKKKGRFCLACFISEVDKVKLRDVDVDQLSDDEKDALLKKLESCLAKVTSS